jgi:hypothetical protein
MTDLEEPFGTEPLSVRLSEALGLVDQFLGRYVAFPSPAARIAVALWVLHTWCVHAFESTPRLHVKSPVKQCGKTRLLESIELLVHDPLPTANTSVPALFRSIGHPPTPTLLIDEIDTVFGPKAPEGSEDLRGLLNAGHRKGTPVLR